MTRVASYWRLPLVSELRGSVLTAAQLDDMALPASRDRGQVRAPHLLPLTYASEMVEEKELRDREPLAGYRTPMRAKVVRPTRGGGLEGVLDATGYSLERPTLTPSHDGVFLFM